MGWFSSQLFMFSVFLIAFHTSVFLLISQWIASVLKCFLNSKTLYWDKNSGRALFSYMILKITKQLSPKTQIFFMFSDAVSFTIGDSFTVLSVISSLHTLLSIFYFSRTFEIHYYSASSSISDSLVYAVSLCGECCC